MPGHFTKIEAGNPYLIAQTAWENLSPSEKTSVTEHEFRSQEWGRRSTGGGFGSNRKVTAPSH
jgi:hypothetical protein